VFGIILRILPEKQVNNQRVNSIASSTRLEIPIVRQLGVANCANEPVVFDNIPLIALGAEAEYDSHCKVLGTFD